MQLRSIASRSGDQRTMKERSDLDEQQDVKLISQERMRQRSVEEMEDVSVPQMQEQIVEMNETMPKIREQIAEVIQLVHQERIQERIVEEIIEGPVSRVMEETVGVVTSHRSVCRATQWSKLLPCPFL